jgi:hypothetical protein
MLDLSNQLVNCRPIVERVWLGNVFSPPTLVTIVRDGRKDVGNYEAIIVTETQTVQTWGKNAKTLLTHARRRAAGI